MLFRSPGKLKERVSGHDVQLNQVYDAVGNMLDEKQHNAKEIKEKGSALKNKNDQGIF
ncbi:hypothetical protein [Niabella aquatica]